MGSVFLRGDSWVGEYRVNGKVRRKTLGKKGVITKTVAREVLRRIEQKIKLGEYDLLDTRIPTLREFAEEYLAYQRDVKQIRSWERSWYAVSHFSRFFGDKRLKEIAPEDIDVYKQRRLLEGAKPGTLARELTVIRHLFNQARKWKRFFNENPISRAGMPEVYDRVERVLSVDEEGRLLSQIPEPFRGIVVIALNTGMRLGEILALRWDWVDLRENCITLPQTHTKTRRLRRVPVNPVVKRELLKFAERRLEAGGSEFVVPRKSYYSLLGRLRRSFREACKRAGIPNLRFHDLRHTAGTRLGESGIPIQTISALLGHTSTRMTERYVHPEESVKRATDLLAQISDSVTDNFTDKEGTGNQGCVVTP
jgi:integrase